MPCVASSPGFPVHEATAVSQACLAGGRGRVWRSTRWTWVKNIQWRDFLTQDSRFLDLESSWASFLARQQSLESALRYDGFWHVFRYSPVMKHSWEIIFVRNGHLKSWKPGQHRDSFCMFLPDVTSHRDVDKENNCDFGSFKLDFVLQNIFVFVQKWVYHGISWYNSWSFHGEYPSPLDQIGGYVHRYASFLGPDGWIHLRTSGTRSQQRADLQFAAATSARAQAHDRLWPGVPGAWKSGVDARKGLSMFVPRKGWYQKHSKTYFMQRLTNFIHIISRIWDPFLSWTVKKHGNENRCV